MSFHETLLLFMRKREQGVGFKAPQEKVKLKCIQKMRELIEIQVSFLLRCLGHRHQLTSECRPVALPQGSLVHVC